MAPNVSFSRESDLPYVSKLRDRLSPLDMAADLYLAAAPDDAAFRERVFRWW
jgi:hypothetical protein